MQTLKQSGQFVPQDLIIAYNALKKQTKQTCRAAINNWWEQKAEEAKKTTQLSMKQGRGGSISKMLKLARLSKTKASTNLKSENGKKLISSLEDKLVRWKSHFEAEAKPHGPIDTKNFDMLMPPTTKMDDEEAEKLSKPFSKAELFH